MLKIEYKKVNGMENIMQNIVSILNQTDDVMYFPILIIVMAAAGLYFTARTRGVQIRLFGE